MLKENWPRVSILVPVIEVDVRQYLYPFLDSIFDLVYPSQKLEILLMDNGLSKETKEMLSRKYPKVKIFGNGKNKYFARAINEIAKKSKGEFLYIINYDTILHSECLKNLVTSMNSDPKIAVA